MIIIVVGGDGCCLSVVGAGCSVMLGGIFVVVLVGGADEADVLAALLIRLRQVWIKMCVLKCGPLGF